VWYSEKSQINLKQKGFCDQIHHFCILKISKFTLFHLNFVLGTENTDMMWGQHGTLPWHLAGGQRAKG